MDNFTVRLDERVQVIDEVITYLQELRCDNVASATVLMDAVEELLRRQEATAHALRERI